MYRSNARNEALEAMRQVARLRWSLPVLAAWLCALVLASDARAQTPPPVTLAGTQQIDLISDVNGHPYRLYIAPPEGYAADDTTRYPALYILDGYRTFPAAVTARAFMDIYDGLAGVILVGIGNGEHTFDAWFRHRWRDYTPTAHPATDSLVARQFDQPVEAVRSGGGPDFLRVLREEVIPFIDASYRTTEDRGLSGQSLGGLFAAYALLEAPDLFQRIGINSPSLWWGDSELFDVEAAFAATHTTLPAHVFLSVGSEEGSAMVPPMERLAETLRSRGYGGLTVDAVVFEDETHTSVVPAQVSRTLRVLYPRRE